MSAVIGMPQALAFYYYHTMWSVFFTELGFNIQTSGKTNRSILEYGTARVPNEACLPLKCYIGHVVQLCGRVDFIFVPRLVCPRCKPAVKLCCPKFIGLPDMVAVLAPDAPILSIDIDLRRACLKDAFCRLARRLDCTSSAARHAYSAAVEAARATGCDDQKSVPAKTDDVISIALLGHHYLREDEYLCLDIKKRISDAGCRIVEHMPCLFSQTRQANDRVHPTSWFFEDDLLFAAHRFLHQHTIDGIIYLLSFGCGAGSITSEIIEHELRRDSHVPILRMIIDEHTAEAGFQTRLESFIDMLRITERHTGVV